jgi:hypothetical protein
MTLERVEIAEGWRAENRRAEHQVAILRDGVVIRLSRAETLNEVAKRLDPETGFEQIVERRERSAVEDAVVGEPGIGPDRATPSGFELQPSRRGAVAQRGNQAPRRAGRAVPIANMGELHRRSEDRPVTERV